MAQKNNKIDSSQLLSVNARILDQVDLMRHVAISRWSISQNTVTYQKNDSHTLSLYLRGGENSYRVDQAHNKGAPGKLCLMPKGHLSDWHINDKIEFLHLYFSSALLSQFAANQYDMDVRLLDLRDVTYSDDTSLKAKLFSYINNTADQATVSPLHAELELYGILAHLIENYNGYGVKSPQLKAGLSPRHMKQVRANIHDNLREKLSIGSLASDLGLSPYHFARMFKLSFGETPADYIIRTRIKKAQHLLEDNLPLAEIALHTGFSQQSHMTDKFKKHTGLTPAAYRREYLQAA